MAVTLTPDFAQILRRRQGELRSFLRASALAAVDTAGDPHEMLDFKDVAAEETRAVVDGVTTSHAAAELAQIQAALARIDDGSYGECIDCGDPIGERRLLAIPATPYCTACQAINERRPRALR